MRRILIPALCLFLLALPSIAPAAEAQRQSVWTVLTTVQAEVVGNYATVSVVADIGNRGPDPEFPFRVRIPDDAFVTGLTIERDGVLHRAEIEERGAARAEYEAHKAREQTGGLVEKDRHSSVYAYLINVAEFTSVRATLTYERHLTADRGVQNLSLEAPVSGFGQDLGARFTVTIRDPAGVSAAWSEPSVPAEALPDGFRLAHAVGPRATDAATPFLVSYAPTPTGDGGILLVDGEGAFAHVFRAPPDARTLPLDLVLVLDVSGSMGREKMAQMKDAAAQVVRTLRNEDRLHLVLFSSDATSPWSGLRAMDAAGRREAGEEVAALLAGGGTNIEAAIHHGFEGFAGADWAAEESRMPLLVLLTDGKPSDGVSDRAALRDIAVSANGHGVNVFAIAFGQDADWPFLHGLAADGQGAALRVPQGTGAEVDLRRFLASLTTPALKDVKARYGAGVMPLQTGAPVLFAGSDLLILGTYDPAQGAPAGTVTARAPDGPRTYATPVPREAGGWLTRLVAYHEIRSLQENIGVEGARPEWTARVLELALAHGFVTDYTSLVVTLEPRATPMADDARAERGDVRVSNLATGPSGTPVASSPAPIGPGPAPGAGGDMPPQDIAVHVRDDRTTEPQVPGPGAALLVLASLAALMLAGARRRG